MDVTQEHVTACSQLQPMVLQHMTSSGHTGEAITWSSSTGSSSNLQVVFFPAGCNSPDVLAILVYIIIS